MTAASTAKAALLAKLAADHLAELAKLSPTAHAHERRITQLQQQLRDLEEQLNDPGRHYGRASGVTDRIAAASPEAAWAAEVARARVAAAAAARGSAPGLVPAAASAQFGLF